MESSRIHVHVPQAVDEEETQEVEAAHHIELPNPSVWPFLLSAAIFVFMAGLLFVSDYPWVSLITIPFVLVGIIGWALEDPRARPTPESSVRYTPTTVAEIMLYQTQEGVDRAITLGNATGNTSLAKEAKQVPDGTSRTHPADLSARRKVLAVSDCFPSDGTYYCW